MQGPLGRAGEGPCTHSRGHWGRLRKGLERGGGVGQRGWGGLFTGRCRVRGGGVAGPVGGVVSGGSRGGARATKGWRKPAAVWSPPVHCRKHGQRGSEDCGDRTVRTAWGTEWLRAKCLTTWNWRAWWFCADREGPCGGGGRCGPSGRRGDGAVSPAVSQIHQLDHTVSRTEPSLPCGCPSSVLFCLPGISTPVHCLFSDLRSPVSLPSSYSAADM